MPLDNPAHPANPTGAMTETTKMTKELHLKLVAAWWDGELEFFYADCGWKPANRAPHSESDLARYRIRPKPTLRPWKPEEVPVGALIRLRNRKTIHSWLIVGFSSETNFLSFGQARDRSIRDLAGYEHSLDGGATWKPCGVEESQ